MQHKKPLILVILDGWGHQIAANTNAISQATTPVWDKLWDTCPHILLSASGLDVGLPTGQMGNSEVGHMTIGAGRVIYQDLTKINQAIADGSFYTNPVLFDCLTNAKKNNKAVHILGLLSPGGVHSHEQHIAAMVNMAEIHNVPHIYVHAFLDGRDTPPQSATASLQKLEPYIASVIGRFYAMDRDMRTERTKAAIDLLIYGHAPYTANSALEALDMAYARGENDEFVQPTIIQPAKIEPGDTVIFMNFRSDRARQLSHALITEQPILKNNLITLTEYDATLPTKIAFPPQPIVNTLTDIISQHNMTQLHIAETEKYAHVTFFFNARREDIVAGETRILIPSPQVATYDLQPEMSAQQITNALVDAIEQKQYDVIICNFANADMVGHTGNIHATIAAIEAIDKCLGQITKVLNEFGGQMLITADHGNAELMWDATTEQPHTAHTTNLVPLLYFGDKTLKLKNDQIYGLQDIAPTVLKLLNIDKPTAMTGVELISA